MNPDFIKNHIPIGAFVKVTIRTAHGSIYGDLIEAGDDANALKQPDRDGGGTSLVPSEIIEHLIDGDTALGCYRSAEDKGNKDVTDHVADIRREREAMKDIKAAD